MDRKAYGKVSAEQFRRLIKHLPEIRTATEELPELLRSSSSEKLREALRQDILWAGLYELPFHDHVAVALYVLGLKDKIIAMARSQDPQEALLDFIDSADSVGENVDGFDTVQLASCVAVVIALQRTVLSIMLFKQSMSGLIEAVREGSDEALFNAVRVDRSSLCCPTIAVRVSKAELMGDKRFFQRLRNALKGPQHKHWESYKDLRYALAALREMGVESLSDAELEFLLCDVLKVYPKTVTARKNHRKHFDESKKIGRH